MSKIHTPFKDVTRVYNKIRKELINLGVLWDGSKLDGVECIYESLQWRGLISWMVFYDFDDRNISFPAIYNGLALDFRWYDKNSALDVMRHEFGHALAHRYPEALREGDLFLRAFGGPYGKRPARGTDTAFGYRPKTDRPAAGGFREIPVRRPEFMVLDSSRV